MNDLDGMRILVTGATAGIGHATLDRLRARGATVLVHGRDRRKVEALARPGGGFVADLSSLSAVADLGRAVADAGPLDVLVNNAGIGFGADRTRREVSADGFELRLAVNLLAPVVLTETLLARGLPTRAVVNVASIGQQPLDPTDWMNERDYDGVVAYRRSKLALIQWTFDQANADPGRSWVAVHPGSLLDTSMVRNAGIAPRGPVSRGADSVCAAIDSALGGATGLYYDEQTEARANAAAYDPVARAHLREALQGWVRPWVAVSA